MKNILEHAMFAKAVADKLGFCAEMKNYKCDFCGAERADVLAFNDSDKMCGTCEKYLVSLRVLDGDTDSIAKKLKLLESLRILIDSIGYCAAPMFVMACFKIFFDQLRSIPEYESIIQEGINDGGRGKDPG